jgi:argininosuccinate synthase
MRVGMGLTRDQEIDYAAERGIEIPITRQSPYSIDVNLWGRSCETGVLEDPWVTPPTDAYEWTVAPADAPDPVELTIDFEGGIPVALDGERLPSVTLVERLHELGGAHGVGRIDHVEDRLVGIKSREIYETPAATILHEAHRALEGLSPREAEVIRWHFGLHGQPEETLRQIGLDLHLSHERVRQIEAEALAKLKRQSAPLRIFLEP